MFPTLRQDHWLSLRRHFHNFGALGKAQHYATEQLHYLRFFFFCFPLISVPNWHCEAFRSLAMMDLSIWLAILTACSALAQITDITSTTALTGTQTDAVTDGLLPTGSEATYLSLGSTITTAYTSALPSQISNNATNAITTSGNSSTNTVTYLSKSGNATATSSGATATNTQPCNDYPEFCNRKYSNITMVTAHNFAFVRKGNAASNQALTVTYQLNDGIRMLSTESHYVNGTIYLCHTNCDILNMGTLESMLIEVTAWVEAHPYDVVTLLLVNSDFIAVENYTAPITNSGLIRYLYRPSQIPMTLDSWPTLSEMILSQQRVVIFMDYQANQTSVPYILDEFSQMWETPFSPTDPNFPCTQQRPPGISAEQAQSRLYLANHNLNTPVDLLGASILVPNTASINQTNAVSGNGSLGVMAQTCDGEFLPLGKLEEGC